MFGFNSTGSSIPFPRNTPALLDEDIEPAPPSGRSAVCGAPVRFAGTVEALKHGSRSRRSRGRFAPRVANGDTRAGLDQQIAVDQPEFAGVVSRGTGVPRRTIGLAFEEVSSTA
jgi:hypothetical protein